MTEQDRQDALLNPRAGDVWEKTTKTSIKTRSVRMAGTWNVQWKCGTRYGDTLIAGFRKWASTAMLVKRGPNA